MTPTHRSRASVGRLLPALAPLLLGASLVVGCAPSGGSPAGEPVATTSVDLPPSYRFAPASIAVHVGDIVTWTNSDNFTHNVQFPDADGPLTMSPGDSVSHRFSAVGTYAYVCSLHPKDMKGTVVVTDG